MTDYLEQNYDDDPNLISIMDELPLWSAPFGMKLLDAIKFKKNMRILDVGCGTGFPIIEIAQRIGENGIAVGIDPWEAVLNRAKEKIKYYNLKNARAIKAHAENLPLEDKFFDLIVSNNGFNNVQDMVKAFEECNRISKHGAQLVFTVNLPDSMNEFYDVMKVVLLNNNMKDEVEKMKEHICRKRKPLDEIESILNLTGFRITNIDYDEFSFRFIDGTTMFNHSMIKYWFLDSWKKIIREKERVKIFEQIEHKLNQIAAAEKELKLSIPFVTIDALKV